MPEHGSQEGSGEPALACCGVVWSTRNPGGQDWWTAFPGRSRLQSYERLMPKQEPVLEGIQRGASFICPLNSVSGPPNTTFAKMLGGNIGAGPAGGKRWPATTKWSSGKGIAHFRGANNSTVSSAAPLACVQVSRCARSASMRNALRTQSQAVEASLL